MTIASEVIIPILQGTFYMIILGWTIFIIYFICKKIFKNIGFYLKYKIFKKQWPEKFVGWCMRAYELGWDEVQVKIFLLLNGKPNKKPCSKREIKEILYIFQEVKKNNEKGGIKNVRNRPSDEQIKKI